MKKKRIVIVFLIVIFVLLIAGFLLYQDNLIDNGKQYSSKEQLCTHFAQSYLRTVQKTDLDNQSWEIAVDIETDLSNLCNLELNEKSLKTYKSSIINNYQK